MPRQHHAGHARALGAAEQRAEVVRIGDPVDDEKEGGLAPRARLAERPERHRLDRPGEGDHTLGRLGAGERVDPPPGHVGDPDPAPRGECFDLVENRRLVHPFGEEDLLDRSLPGEKLAHRLAALDLIAAEATVGTPRPAAPATAAGGRAPAISTCGPAGAIPATAAGGTPASGTAPAAGTTLAQRNPASSEAPGAAGRGLEHRLDPSGASPSGSPVRFARSPADGHQQHHRDAGDPLRPTERPNPSARVAFTLTGAPSTAPRRSAIVATYGSESRAFGHDGAVGVHRRPARLPREGDHPGEKADAVCALKNGIGVGGVVAEVAEARRAQHRVGTPHERPRRRRCALRDREPPPR